MGNYYFIRYSCSDLNNPTSSRITSVHIANYEGQIEVFSLLKEAEFKFPQIPINQLSSSQIDELELSLLTKLKKYLALLLKGNPMWYYWKMSSPSHYHFDCFTHRWRVLSKNHDAYFPLPKAGQMSCLHEKICQSDIELSTHLGTDGNSYAKLADFFNVDTDGLLSGSQEAEYYEKRSWKPLIASGSKKISILVQVHYRVSANKDSVPKTEASKDLSWLGRIKDPIALISNISGIGERVWKFFFSSMSVIGIGTYFSKSVKSVFDWLIGLF